MHLTLLLKKEAGLIDSQDAIIGNPLYDVASLIDDVKLNYRINYKMTYLNFITLIQN